MALRYVLAVLLLGGCSAGVGNQQPHADEQSAGIDLQPPKPIVITDIASASAACAANRARTAGGLCFAM